MTDGSSSSNDTFVAFCDILGFSDKTVSQFDDTLEIYKDFGELLTDFQTSEVELTMYSDSILLTSKSLAALLSAVQTVWFFALAHKMMIRGAITKGRYWQLRQGNHLMVVSDALVRAVKLEKMVGVPAVVVADDVEIPDAAWIERFRKGTVGTPILHFRDRNIVNPFNVFWLASAKNRALALMDESPTHRDKYLWFLALHQAVSSDADLVPTDVLARFIGQGFVRKTDQFEDTAGGA